MSLIDLHCHILPFLDDGADSLEESLSMARTALSDGIDTVVATPHSLNGLYANPVTTVRACVASFREALRREDIRLRVHVGSDIHFSPPLVERIEKGEAATIGDNQKYILLELPSQIIPPNVKDEIFSLKIKGITPIITHPERHPVIQHDPDVLWDLVHAGALGQVTAMSVTGDFGELVKRCAEKLLSRRLVHVLSSDAHSSASRPPILSPAVERAAEILGSFDEAEGMVSRIPSAILSGEILDFAEPRRARGGWRA